MIKLKSLLKEANDDFISYDAKEIEPEVKKVLGKLIKSVEPYSNNKVDKKNGHVKFNFVDNHAMHVFMDKQNTYVPAIEKALSRKLRADIMLAGITRGNAMLSFTVFSENDKSNTQVMHAMTREKALDALEDVIHNIEPYSKEAVEYIEDAIKIIQKFKTR
jgi:hypothetical protein